MINPVGDETNEDQIITQKLHGLTEYNEKDYAKTKYELALQEMLAHPENEAYIQAFIQANTELFEVEDAYHQGTKLLLIHEVKEKELHPVKTRKIFNPKGLFSRRLHGL